MRVTHYLAIDAMRATATRRRHEQLAAQQHSEHSYHSCSPWTSLAPVLDDGALRLHALSDSDRTILTLRLLQDWSAIEQIAMGGSFDAYYRPAAARPCSSASAKNIFPSVVSKKKT